jgi:hypothetical protein
VARHFPRIVRKNVAPARRSPWIVGKLYNPGFRRSAPPAQAGHGGRTRRCEALGPPGAVGAIQRWKDRGLTPDRITPAEDIDFAGRRARDPYAAYQARLRALNAADFGDLLLYVTELLRTQPDILQQYHRMLPLHPGGRIPGHQPDPVLVAAVTCAIPPNICPCVGDDDQCLATGTQVTAADGRISAAKLGDRDATTMGRRVEGFVAAVASIQSAFWFRCMPDGTCDVDRRVGNQAIRPPIFLQEHRARSGMNRGNQASRPWGSLCANGTRSARRLLPAGARAFVAFYTVIARGAATRQSPASKGRPERIEVAASHRSLQ